MFLKVFISPKTGKKCFCLCAHGSVRDYNLSYDVATICDIFDMSPSVLMKMEVGCYEK